MDKKGKEALSLLLALSQELEAPVTVNQAYEVLSSPETLGLEPQEFVETMQSLLYMGLISLKGNKLHLSPNIVKYIEWDFLDTNPKPMELEFDFEDDPHKNPDRVRDYWIPGPDEEDDEDYDEYEDF